MTKTDGAPRHLVVLGHPDVRSFNAALAQRYCDTARKCGQKADLRDLYAIGFDPLLKQQERPSEAQFHPAPDVAAELALLRAADVLTLVYPIWFGMPPAIIKGYVDRVLGAGFGGTKIRRRAKHPILYGKRLMILSSSASTRPWLEEQGQWLSLRQAFDSYLATVFSLASHDHIHFDSIVDHASPDYIAECLEEAGNRAYAFCAQLEHERNRRRIALLGAGSR
ncbi:MAG: NAD(P)H dehydrogenase [Sphingomonas sp.]|nr:NAD(P)H dehydrogenase [Sphingomonas sp.]|tara:strand:+ start:537 stop:1205 length:669 start_codon:yes stop_codon:yes gene_type:complete